MACIYKTMTTFLVSSFGDIAKEELAFPLEIGLKQGSSCFALGTLGSEKHAYVDSWDRGGGTVALPWLSVW